MNNDFFVTREAIRQWLPNRLTRDKKKSLFTVTHTSFFIYPTIQELQS